MIAFSCQYDGLNLISSGLVEEFANQLHREHNAPHQLQEIITRIFKKIFKL